MPKCIFNSRITLKFKDKYYERKYSEVINTYLKTYNLILSTVLTIMSLIISIIMLFEFSSLKENFNSFYSIIACLTSLGLNIFINLLCLFMNNIKLQEWITNVNYTMILFVFTAYRFYFVYVLKIDFMIYILLFIIEMLFRMSWFFLGLIDFVQGVYLQIICIVMNFGFYCVSIPSKFNFRISVFTFVWILTSVMSYFYIRESKRSFYYNLSLRLKNQWYESIIDNMNSGFISIKNNKIQYYNKTLSGFMNRNALNSNTEAIELNKETFDLNELFENVNISEEMKVNKYEEVVELVRDQYNVNGENFVFIGTKDVKISESCYINLEIFGRCCSSNHFKIDRYEFIFNDISRPKQIEQKSAELKYKTLFLSKVAHEFKNPLLCICELVDQVNEELFGNDPIAQCRDGIRDVLTQIKSMSNYLIILVKDMDFFSQKNSGAIEKRIQFDKVNLSDILKFCKDIVLALIKKSHKQQNVSFQVIKDKYLPSAITTDEIKLKQILINLLSNAVKYTYNGAIHLKITMNENNIKFQVNDTGKGISDNQREKLFTPFSNEFDKLNKVSSGLGLSIVKELVELLGSKIEFESAVSKGSSFWFSLRVDENDLNISYISDATVTGTHFNTLPITKRFLSNSAVGGAGGDYNIIVADDEVTIRQSTIRLLSRTLKKKNINANILEASDGIECLYHYYINNREGKNINCIISDETMAYMNGSTLSQLLNNLSKDKNLTLPSFYILTAYENLSLGNAIGAINDVFTKPLRKQHIEEILNALK
jgi:signal transduction histidine kinase/CheY-like chemotaxis protein